MIRQAIKQGKKIKFNLCVYDYGKQNIRLVPYGRHGKVLPETPEKYKEDVHRICSPFDIIFSNGRYYMLGADLETERHTDLQYKLYRVDLMSDVTINRAKAVTKEEAGLSQLNDLFGYRMENPYMFAGKAERVRIRVDADQLTQIVDWLEEIGYSYIEDCLPERGNYSLTMIFFRDGNPKYIHSPGKYRENRSVVCKEDDLLICGSHFPCESDEVFLNHMENFVTDYLNDDFLLVGDLNANDQTRGNKKMINRLLDKGAVDLWVMFGNDENTPTEAQYQGRLDYAIASPSLAKKVKNIEIDPFLMNAGVTDHAAIIVDINE